MTRRNQKNQRPAPNLIHPHPAPGRAFARVATIAPPRRAMSGVAQGAPAYDAAMILKVVGCVVGVVGSLLVYGILQERIMTKPYDDGGSEESFTFSVFLVMNNRIVSMAVAVATLAWMRGAVQPVAPMYKYAAVSASNVVATTCQYEALKYVSFPAQTMAKSAKILPALAWGVAVNGRSYGAKVRSPSHWSPYDRVGEVDAVP